MYNFYKNKNKYRQFNEHKICRNGYDQYKYQNEIIHNKKKIGYLTYWDSCRNNNKILLLTVKNNKQICFKNFCILWCTNYFILFYLKTLYLLGIKKNGQTTDCQREYEYKHKHYIVRHITAQKHRINEFN